MKSRSTVSNGVFSVGLALGVLAACNQSASSAAASLSAASFAQADSWFETLTADPAAIAKGASAIASQPLGSLQSSMMAQVTDGAFDIGGYHIQGLKSQMLGESAGMQNFASKYSSLQDFIAKEHVAVAPLTRASWRSEVTAVGEAMSKGVGAVTGSAGLGLLDAAADADVCAQLRAASADLVQKIGALPTPTTREQAATKLNVQAGATSVLTTLWSSCTHPAAEAQSPAGALQNELQAPSSSTPSNAGQGARRPQ